MSKYQEEEDARDRVIQAAMEVVDYWTRLRAKGIKAAEITPGNDLVSAVRALRSLHADRGLRDPGTSREQATGAEPAHGEDRNDREQS